MRHIAFAISAFAASVATAQTPVEMDWVTTESAHYIDAESKMGLCVFANNNSADFGIDNSGVLDVKSDGTYRWTLGLRADWAVNMMVDFKDIEASTLDQLTVSSPDGEQVLLYTSRDIDKNNRLSTMPLKGDSIIVELDGHDVEKANFRIDMVSVGFKTLPELGENRYLKALTSESCEVDVTCDNKVNDEKQSVCRLLVKSKKSSSYGSGTLVNNTKQDGAPYLLTAAHLIAGEFVSGVALFNYEKPQCQTMANISEDSKATTSTATAINIEEVLFRNDTKDVLLLKLKNAPPSECRPYWAGWNVTGKIPEGGVYVIHHPGGDVKKISRSETAIPGSTYDIDKTTDNQDFDKASHWYIEKWTSGSTEGGSSGGGLFDANKRVVGTLTGGMATCRQTKNDYFAMTSESWSGLSKYLSPDDSSVKEMDGAYLSEEKYAEEYGDWNDKTMDCKRLGYNEGYLTGHNKYKTSAVAQFMETGNNQIEVTGICFMPAVCDRENIYPNQRKELSFSVAIWEAKDGEPDEMLTSEQYSASKLNQNDLIYVELSNKVKTDGNLYVGITLDYTAESDSIALYHADGNGGRFMTDGEWKKATDFGMEKEQDVFIGFRYRIVDTNAVETIDVANDIIVSNIARNQYVVNAEKLEKIEIFDIVGRKIDEKNFNGTEEVTINLDNYLQGFVVARIKVNGKYKTIKLTGR